MSPGSKAGVGAALQTIGQGLMQYTQFNIEETRQQNLERIRQQERGEDLAERQIDRETQQGNWSKSFQLQEKNAAEDAAFKEKSLASQERARLEAARAAAAARGDAKEARAFEAFEKVDNLFQDRLRDLEKAEREMTVTPEIALQQRVQMAKESAAKKAELVRRYPFLKGYTVDDYLQPPPGEGKNDAATPAPAEATPAPAKKPMKFGMDPPPQDGSPDPVEEAMQASGIKRPKTLGEAYDATVTVASEAIGAVAGAHDKVNKRIALKEDVPDVMRRLRQGVEVEPSALKRIAKSGASEEELRRAGANDQMVAVIKRLQATR